MKKNLTGEYELLALCHWFKGKFDEHAVAQGLKTVPSKFNINGCNYVLTLHSLLEFYFNFPDSILGILQHSSTSSGSTPVPFQDFIATPLLPCGLVDPKVRKYTGNENFGDASDDMTKAIHAFVHFSVAYSQDSILFCDLQGNCFFSSID